MRTLVIIVTYNAMQWAERCFNSLRESTAIPDVYVVDNGSTDGTQAYIQEHYPEVMFKQSETNLGFGRANNLGLQYAIDNNYDYVYLLNQDAWVFPDTIGTLVDLAVRYPQYGIISPFQMGADLYSIDRNFSVRLKGWHCYHEILNDIYNNSPKDIYEAESVMAAHWFMTRECIMKVGGFSPTFPHYGEDDNYSDRVKYKGFKIGVTPNLKVVHDRQWRKVDKSKTIYQNYTAYLCKLSSPKEGHFTESFFSVVFHSFMNVAHYKSIAPLKYLLRICSNINNIKKNRTVSIKADCAFLINKTV